MLDASAIAESYLALHRQTATAWSHEIDLRPRLENVLKAAALTAHLSDAPLCSDRSDCSSLCASSQRLLRLLEFGDELARNLAKFCAFCGSVEIERAIAERAIQHRDFFGQNFQDCIDIRDLRLHRGNFCPTGGGQAALTFCACSRGRRLAGRCGAASGLAGCVETYLV